MISEECLPCLNSADAYCNLHRPKPISLEESIAIACQILVNEGHAERIDEGTIRLVL